MNEGKLKKLIVTGSPSKSDVLGKGILIIFFDPVTILSSLNISLFPCSSYGRLLI